MRRALVNLFLLTLPAIVVCLVVGELVLRFLVPACEMPDPVWDAHWRLLRFDARRAEGLFTAGRLAQQRGHWRVNRAGWVSCTDYREPRQPGKLRVAIIGDSFIEALQVDTERSVASVLGRLLGGRAEVLAFGVSGAPLSQYLQMARYVTAVYDPDIVVVNVVHNDFDESLSGVGQEPFFLHVREAGSSFVEVEPAAFVPSSGRRLFKRLALVRYVADNLRLRSAVYNWRVRNARESLVANVDAATLAGRGDLVTRATRYLVETIAKTCAPRVTVFMMDAPRDDLYAGRTRESAVWWLHDVLREAVVATGSRFLDLSGPFEAHYLAHRERFDTRWDRHWNELGHRVVAEALCRDLVLAAPSLRGLGCRAE